MDRLFLAKTTTAFQCGHSNTNSYPGLWLSTYYSLFCKTDAIICAQIGQLCLVCAGVLANAFISRSKLK